MNNRRLVCLSLLKKADVVTCEEPKGLKKEVRGLKKPISDDRSPTKYFWNLEPSSPAKLE